MDEALIQQMLQAGVTEERERALNQRMRRGQMIASMFPTPQGANVGGTYQAASPLEHLASAMARVVGMRQMKGAEDELAGLGNQRAKGRQAFVDALVKASTPQQPAAPVWEPPDFMKPPPQNAPLSMAPPKAPAPKLSLGVLGALSGDPALAAAGRAMGDEEARAAAEAAARQKAEREGLSLQADMDYRNQQLGLGRDRLALDRDRLRVDQEQAAAAAMRKAQEDAAKAAGERGKSGDELRKELMGQQIFKDTQQVATAYQKIATASPSGPGDISLIFGYMKLLDPASTVREGEFATAENAGGAFSKVGSLYNRVLRGEKLPDDVRQQFRVEAEKVYQAQSARLAPLLNEYRRIAEQRGVPVDDVVLNLGFPLPGQSPAQAAPVGPAAQRAQGKDGRWYVLTPAGWEPE